DCSAAIFPDPGPAAHRSRRRAALLARSWIARRCSLVQRFAIGFTCLDTPITHHADRTTLLSRHTGEGRCPLPRWVPAPCSLPGAGLAGKTGNYYRVFFSHVE